MFRLPYQEDAGVRSLTFDAHAAPYSRPFPGVPSGLPTDAYGTVRPSSYSANRDFTYTARGMGRGTSWDTRAAAGVRALPTPDRLSPAAGRTGHSPCARPCFLRDRSTA